MLSLAAGRIAKLSQIDEMISFFVKQPDYDAELFLNKKNKVTAENAPIILNAVLPVLSSIDSWDNDTLYGALLPIAEQLSVKSGAVMWCLRIAVSGLSVTPGGATEIMTVIGKEETLARLNLAISKF